ncbi:MAG: glucose 1-dehydrogenase, partial [Alphaproteobacteria bacterium]
MRLNGKIAIVTGSASGFGKAIARSFAAEGGRVLVADINKSGADAAAREIGNGASPCQVDVTKAEEVEAMVRTCLDIFGDLDILVNNAGVTHRNRPMLEVDEATFDRVYAVNVKSIFHSTHAVVPFFRKKGGGIIINIASTAGLRPRPGLTWYNGSKGAAVILSKSMAV